MPCLFPCCELEMKSWERREVQQKEDGSQKIPKLSSSTFHHARNPLSHQNSSPSPVDSLLSARRRKGADFLTGVFACTFRASSERAQGSQGKGGVGHGRVGGRGGEGRDGVRKRRRLGTTCALGSSFPFPRGGSWLGLRLGCLGARGGRPGTVSLRAFFFFLRNQLFMFVF